MRGLRPLLLTVPVLYVAACGAVPGTASALLGAGASSASGDWLTSDQSSVTLLRLLDAKGSLSGSVNDVEVPSSNSGPPVTTTSLSVSGAHQGAALTLTVNAGLGITQTWSGSLKGLTLTLQVPQKDGSLQTAKFQRADENRYEAAVKNLSDRVTQARQEEAQQAQASAQAQAQAQAEEEAQASQAAASQALAAAQSNLSDAMNSLNQSLAALSVQSKVTSAMADAQAGYQSEADAYNAARALAGPTANCQQLSDAITKVSDTATDLSSQLAAVSSAVGDVDGAVGQVQSAVGSARQTVQEMQAAGGAPEASVTAAISDADAKASAASQAGNTANAQVQDMSNKSDQILNDADKLSEDCNQNG